ncbi:uncharacterized protein LOC120351041 [Nilaparvata lugens]|uniref:uncharacterized protein LOC120351041 n=1 Tax=Nilaparvata lugens TaxID=108931 RepID=UPI00193DE604|nr:uncharacterized protein LOC120351041 [Nilaparvata lugens]
MKFYRVMAAPVLLYGSESWITTKSQESRLQAAEMRFLRRTKGCNTVNTRLTLAVDVRGWGEVSDRQSRLDISRALGTRHGSREFSQFIRSLTVCDRTSMKRKQHNPSILDFFKKKKSTSSSVDQQQANTTCSSSSELEQSFNTDPAPTTTGVSCLEPKPGPSGSNEAPAPTTTGVSCLEPKPGPSGSNKAPAPTTT